MAAFDGGLTQSILMAVGEGVFGVDFEGRCLFCNPTALRILGYESEDLVGRNIHDLIHGKHKDGTLCSVSECGPPEIIPSGERGHRVR